ncbi:MAG TPA: type II toxin-antitoxin system VapC family toxin [Solirubrobacteraceae bacterium]|nr:type II toxin-antitoxin system VapC family toxin [Solirubrobacteraceae bacterium]
MIVLDTTVLVYAKGAEHPLRDPSRRLIEAVTDGELQATTTVEAIQEFVHVRARRRGRTDAVALGNDYADLLSPLLTVTGDHLRRGLSIFEHAEHLGAFDAVLAAAAMSAGAQALVSADTAFAAVPTLSHVIPDERGVTNLLSSVGPLTSPSRAPGVT